MVLSINLVSARPVNNEKAFMDRVCGKCNMNSIFPECVKMYIL